MFDLLKPRRKSHVGSLKRGDFDEMKKKVNLTSEVSVALLRIIHCSLPSLLGSTFCYDDREQQGAPTKHNGKQTAPPYGVHARRRGKQTDNSRRQRKQARMPCAINS